MTEKTDFQVFVEAAPEAHGPEYLAAFDLFCERDALEAERARLSAAAGRSKGQERESNIRQIAGIDTAINKVRATLKAIQERDGISSGCERDENVVAPPPKKSKPDALDHAISAGKIAYFSKRGVEPTAQALFSWLGRNDTTDTIFDFDESRGILTWKRADGGLAETGFKAFQNRKSVRKK